MQVRELIERLQKCPPSASVRFFVDWDDRRTVDDVSPEGVDDTVLLGTQLPPEVFARDFKYGDA